MLRVRDANINTEENWDEIYATPESATRWTQWGAVDLVAKIAAHIPPNSTVLDVATGAGLGPQHIARLRPDIRWYGTDKSHAAIRYLRKHSPVDWRGVFVDDIVTGLLLVGTATFDVVMCTELLEHLEAPADAVTVLWRIVRPGGRIIVTVPRENVVDTEYHVWSISQHDLASLLSPHGSVHTELARSDRQIIGVCQCR